MIVIAESVFVADIVVSNVQKDDMGSLPDEKDVKVDIDHIMENHHPSSGKGPRKDKFPDWMTGPMIEETVRQSYQNAKDNFPDSVIKIQQDIRYYLEGTVAGEKNTHMDRYSGEGHQNGFPEVLVIRRLL